MKLRVATPFRHSQILIRIFFRLGSYFFKQASSQLFPGWLSKEKFSIFRRFKKILFAILSKKKEIRKIFHRFNKYLPRGHLHSKNAEATGLLIQIVSIQGFSARQGRKEVRISIHPPPFRRREGALTFPGPASFIPPCQLSQDCPKKQFKDCVPSNEGGGSLIFSISFYASRQNCDFCLPFGQI